MMMIMMAARRGGDVVVAVGITNSTTRLKPGIFGGAWFLWLGKTTAHVGKRSIITVIMLGLHELFVSLQQWILKTSYAITPPKF